MPRLSSKSSPHLSSLPFRPGRKDSDGPTQPAVLWTDFAAALEGRALLHTTPGESSFPVSVQN